MCMGLGQVALWLWNVLLWVSCPLSVDSLGTTHWVWYITLLRVLAEDPTLEDHMECVVGLAEMEQEHPGGAVAADKQGAEIMATVHWWWHQDKETSWCFGSFKARYVETLFLLQGFLYQRSWFVENLFNKRKILFVQNMYFHIYLGRIPNSNWYI